MRSFIFLGALLLAACSQSPSELPKTKTMTQVAPAATAQRAGLSPSAPIKLTYQVEDLPAGQPQRVDLSINTRLNSGVLLVEVAKKEGADIIGNPVHRIDLANAASPIELQLQALQLGEGEHFLVLLLTVETEMGPMSRSFRIDLVPVATDESQ